MLALPNLSLLAVYVYLFFNIYTHVITKVSKVLYLLSPHTTPPTLLRLLLLLDTSNNLFWKNGRSLLGSDRLQILPKLPPSSKFSSPLNNLFKKKAKDSPQ